MKQIDSAFLKESFAYTIKKSFDNVLSDLSARKKQLIERKDQTKLLEAELSQLIDEFKD